jgi:DNA-binding transcriptional regulator YdaS (Cro superfamily)
MISKFQALEIFGGTHAALAIALGMTRSAISQWPSELTTAQQDRVLGAALRLRKPIPPQFRKRARRAHPRRTNGNGSS